MKVKIKKSFRDIDTLQIMRPGNESEYTEERALRLARSGFVYLLEAPQAMETTEEVVIPDQNDQMGMEEVIDLPAPEEVTQKTGEVEGSQEYPLADGEDAEDTEVDEKEEIADEQEKNEFSPFPEKSEEPKKRGRKPKLKQ